jgi:hypothetical protein
MGMFRFPGPDGTVYTFDTYLGCGDCGTPAGITIAAYSGSMLTDFFEPDQPYPLPWFDEGTEYQFFPLPMIDPDTIAKDLIGALGADLTLTDKDGETYTISELFEVQAQDIRQAIEKHIFRTVDEWRKERAKRGTKR